MSVILYQHLNRLGDISIVADLIRLGYLLSRVIAGQNVMAGRASNFLILLFLAVC